VFDPEAFFMVVGTRNHLENQLSKETIKLPSSPIFKIANTHLESCSFQRLCLRLATHKSGVVRAIFMKIAGQLPTRISGDT
jgi:hypothetical protein